MKKSSSGPHAADVRNLPNRKVAIPALAQLMGLQGRRSYSILTVSNLE